MKTKIKKWKMISSRIAFKNKYFQVYRDVVLLPNGQRYTYYLKNKKARAVLVLPIDRQGRIMIAKEFRYPTGQVIYGAVAGSIEKNEKPLHAAMRELREETGCRAKRFISLGRFYANPGREGAVFYPYLAAGVARVGEPQFETAEQVETEWIKVQQFDRLVARNGVVDPFLMSAYLLFKCKKSYGKIRNHR